MTTPYDLEMAILAYNSYLPSAANKLPIGNWVELKDFNQDDTTIGFGATVYRSGTQIVIAFRGTDDPKLQDFLTGNIPAASGWMSPQVLAAIRLVSDVMAANPGTDLSFTGHSLGGGLASLMAAFFQTEATTFDMAPFGVTAHGQSLDFVGAGVVQVPIIRDSAILSSYLAAYTAYQQGRVPPRTVDPLFTQYVNAVEGGGAVADAMLAFTRGNIHGFFLNDEILELVRAIPGLSTLVGTLTQVDIGETTLNDASVDVIEAALDATLLHSQVLLIALMAAPSLQAASQRLPALLEQLLSSDLYARNDEGAETNFLNRLLRNHFAGGVPGGPTALTAFAQELLRLGEVGSAHLPGIREGLTSAIIEYFNYVDVGTSSDFVQLGSNSVSVDLAWIPIPDGLPQRAAIALTVGLASQLPLDAPGARARATSMAREAAVWTVQVGNNGMYTAGRDANEVQVGGLTVSNEMNGAAGNDVLVAGNTGDTLNGGVDDDVLIGGSGADLLYGGYSGTDREVSDEDYLHGGAGNDTLIGGRGRDELYGGLGADTYNFFDGDGSDIVLDSDGLGSLSYEGVQVVIGERIGENIWRSADGELVISRHPLSPETPDMFTVTIRNTTGSTLITVRLWQVGHLGLSFLDTPIDSEVDPQPATGTVIDPTDPNATVGYRGSVSADVYGTSANDLVYTRSIVAPGGMVFTATDQGGDDVVIGGDGVDAIYGGAGDDWISGNGSADYIVGDLAMDTAGNNNIAGGLGADIVYGRDGRDQIWGDDRIDLYTAIGLGNDALGIDARGDYLHGGNGDDEIVGSNNWDLLSGGAGRDVLVGMGGNDLIAGDRVYELSGSYPVEELEQPGFSWDWTIQHDVVTQPDGSTLYTLAIRDLFPVHASTPEGGDADTIYAGSGNDGVLAGVGDDLVDGGAGDDLLAGEEGNDTLIGGAGNDMLDGGDDTDVSGADFLDGGEGDDQLYGANGSDTLLGGEGDDRLSGDDPAAASGGADFLDGGSGNDLLQGGAFSDTLIGGAGNDTLFGDSGSTPVGYQGDDYLEGGAGEDVMIGAGGSDTLIGGEDGDEMHGDGAGAPDAVQGRDYLEGGGGNDIMTGGGNDDTLYGGEGNDELHGDASTVAVSAQGDDILDGGAGDDILVGYAGNDRLFGGEGNDQLHGDQTGLLAEAMGRDWLEGNAGEDTLNGYGGDDRLFGGADIDTLFGGDGSDELSGGAGNDTLVGGAGNDVLRGDEGVDVLQGGGGDDTYVFDNEDLIIEGTIADGIIDTSGTNRVVFSGLALGDLTFASGGTSGSLALTASNGSLGLVIRDAFSNAVSQFVFSDGAAMTAADLIGSLYTGYVYQSSYADGVTLLGGASADNLYAYGNNMTVSGGRGGDYLNGGSGSTTYLYRSGDGPDTINDRSYFDQTGGTSANTLRFGPGIALADLSLSSTYSGLELRVGTEGDAITLGNYDLSNLAGGERTFDRLEFADGTVLSWQQFVAQTRVIIESTSTIIEGTSTADVITGGSNDQTLRGLGGDDRLNGAGGNDLLVGGAGNDRYVFDADWGIDTVDNGDDVAGSTEVLEFTGITDASQLRFYRYDDTLIVSQHGTGNRVMVAGHFAGHGIDQILLAGGVVLDPGSITISSPQDQITDGPDVIFGTQGDDTITAGSDDIVYGGRGNDTLEGGSEIRGDDGNDTITGTTATEYIYGGAGNDVIQGGGFQSYGGDGDDYVRGLHAVHGDAGNDNLQTTGDVAEYVLGGAGDDILNGNAWGGPDYRIGGDWLQGGEGSDTYLITTDSRGHHIVETDAEGDDIDTVQFDAGITREQVTFRSNRYGMLEIVVRDTNGQVLTTYSVKDFQSSTHPNHRIERAVFAEGTVIDAEELAEILRQGTDGMDVIVGTPGADILYGREGGDTITGLAGNDLLIGGTGGDTYVFGAGFGNDIIQDVESGAGTDTSWDTVVFNAPITRANLLFSVSASQPGDLVIGVRNTTDTVTVRNFFDSDTAGVERIEVDLYTSITRDQILDMFSIIGTAGADILNTPATGGRLRGLGGNDVLNGGAGADYLDGGADVDQMVGGGGNDRYIVENLGDVVSEQGGSGIDRVDSSVTFTLSEGVENLTLVGSASVNGFGNALSNILIGNAGDNRLDGGAGADMLHGGSGSDIYVIDDVNDQIVEDSYHTDRVESYISFTLGEMLENLTLLGNASINGTGNAGQNILIGNAGNNMLDGGAGNDSMHGGAGDDTFAVQDTDTVTEGANEGTDTVRAADTFTLGSNIENLVLTGIGSSWATGNELDNSLTGNSGSNRLDGRAGADRMTGGLGDDSYVIDNVDDVVVELQGEGYDVISSYLSLVLPEHFEGLTLQNNGSHLNATGNAANNQLIGNWSDNILDGGAGMDMMFGQDGADTYLVDNVADICEDDGFSGIDTVRSTVTYTLSTGIENLVLLGTGAMNGTGNALNNDITGTSADNILDGGSGGIDVLRGGLGNDFYRVTHTSSQVIEQGSEGSDTVESTATFTLGSYIENLTLTGTGNINGTGNDLDNSIIGNAGTNTLTGGAGNDRLDGGDGRDTMLGGTGNDTFVFRQSNDAATEAANEGTDTVEAYITVASLGTNLENLTLMGSDAINGTGNAAANVVRGNAGANTLSGGTGSDTLIGGNGADIYTFTTAFGSETIDNASTDTAQDRLNFTNLQRSQVTFTRSGNDLVMTRNGTTTDNVRVSNWFSAAGNQLDFVQFTNQTLTAAQVNALFPTLAQVDETDLAVTRIVDAINHFDAVDQRITVDNEVHSTTPWSLQLAGATVERWSVDHAQARGGARPL